MWKYVMAWTKEISEDLRKTIVNVHQVNMVQSYFQRVWTPTIHWSGRLCTMEAIQYHCYIPKNNRSTKITSRGRCIILWEAPKNPMLTKSPLFHWQNVSVHEITIMGEYRITKVFMTGLQAENHCSSKRTLLSTISKITWVIQRIGREFCASLTSKKNFLA